jgi:menaquinone-dependent protoporphyrinogen oxidase
MASLILVYSTTDGHTVEICERIKAGLEQQSHQVTITDISDIGSQDLAAFDKIVLGASIRYGKHNRAVYDFIEKNLELLQSKPNAFFSVNAVARKPEKRQPDTNPYLRKFLKKIPWQPQQLAVFAGKIDYQKYTTLDRLMIRFIMWMTKGPTDPNAVVEFTDWQQVEQFATQLSEID